jgi:CheY-like chemotaxis protein
MNLIASEQSRQGSRHPVLRVLDRGERSASPADEPMNGTESRRPELQLVADRGREPSPRVAPVLLAGADERSRALLRAEFGATLPPRTRWVEAGDVAEALERAAHSRMVILAGDLDDVDAESLMRMLGRRHPELPVIFVEAPQQAVAGVCG